MIPTVSAPGLERPVRPIAACPFMGLGEADLVDHGLERSLDQGLGHRRAAAVGDLPRLKHDLDGGVGRQDIAVGGSAGFCKGFDDRLCRRERGQIRHRHRENAGFQRHALIRRIQRIAAEEDQIETLDIDNKAVREGQIRRLERTRQLRDPKKWAAAIEELKSVARSGKGNLLAAAVEAARARASVGEISDAMRETFGDYVAVPEVVSDIYGPASQQDPEYQILVSRLNTQVAKTGRKPKILVAKLGQDGHDRGAKVISSAFGDIGFDVVTGPLFQTPDEAADLAIGEKVDVIGVSSLAAGHKTLMPELVERLKSRGADHIIVICGGVIPRKDYQFLQDHGVSAVFGPGTNVVDAARAVLDLAEGRLRNA